MQRNYHILMCAVLSMVLAFVSACQPQLPDPQLLSHFSSLQFGEKVDIDPSALPDGTKLANMAGSIECYRYGRGATSDGLERFVARFDGGKFASGCYHRRVEGLSGLLLWAYGSNLHIWRMPAPAVKASADDDGEEDLAAAVLRQCKTMQFQTVEASRRLPRGFDIGWQEIERELSKPDFCGSFSGAKVLREFPYHHRYEYSIKIDTQIVVQFEERHEICAPIWAIAVNLAMLFGKKH